MEFTNFQLDFESGFAIKVASGESEWDLHNFGTFLGFYYNVIQHELTMFWSVRGHLTATESQTRLDIVFTNVTRLEVSPRDPEMPDNEDETLNSIGTISSDTNFAEIVQSEALGECWTEQPGEAAAHLLFRFWGGQAIRLAAESAKLVIVSVT